MEQMTSVRSRLTTLCITALTFLHWTDKAGSTISRWQCDPLIVTSIPSVFLVEMRRQLSVTGYKDPDWTNKTIKYNYVYCAARGLKKVPNYFSWGIQLLDLSKNLIAKVQASDFCSYPELVAIELANNCKSYGFTFALVPCYVTFTIEKDSFKCLHKLRFLDLSGNNIVSLPYLPASLSVFLACYTNLKPVSGQQLDHLKDLDIVRMTGNCILGDANHFCPSRFTLNGRPFKNSNLRYLDLGYNNFTRVPTNLLTGSLRGLRLRGNPIHVIRASDFAELGNLQFLKISWTSQYDGHHIPLLIEEQSLDKLENLKWLDLAGNMLKSLPKYFLGKNQKLEHLDLSFNCFMQLATNPKMLPRLPCLRFLDLSANSRCDASLLHTKYEQQELVLGNAFLMFPRLQTLKLGAHIGTTWLNKYLSYGIKYRSLTNRSLAVLVKLKNFTDLNLAASGTRNVDTAAWKGLVGLKRLDLGINEVGENPPALDQEGECEQRHRRSADRQETKDSLEDMVNTSISENFLILSQNAISDLEAYPFRYSAFVQRLDLSHNYINYVYDHTFRPLVHLKKVDLRFNPIRVIAPGAFAGLSCFSSLRLNETKFTEAFRLDFLLNASSKYLSLQAGGLFKDFYKTIKYYSFSGVYFNKVKIVDFSGIVVPLYTISLNLSPYRVFPNLLSLTIERSQLRFPLGSNFFEGIPDLTYLDISSCEIQHFPYLALSKLTKLEYLDISHNMIDSLSSEIFQTAHRLKRLTISHNFISHIASSLFNQPTHFNKAEIDLSYNRITDFGPSVIGKAALLRLNFLDIRHNSLTCDCSMSKNFGWLVHSKEFKNHKLPGFLPYCPPSMFTYYGGCVACKSGKLPHSNSVFSFSASYFCQEDLAIILASSFTGATLLFMTAVLLLHNRRCKTLVAEYVHRDIRKEDSRRSYEEDSSGITVMRMRKVFAFHGFVFYDNEDRVVGDWVDNHLVPEMQSGSPSFDLCVHGRDVFCGATQVKQVLLQMESSRKTIVVLTDDFAASSRCRYVLSVLEDWAYRSGWDRSVFIAFDPKVGQSKLLKRRRWLNPNTVLNIPSSIDSMEVFWEATRTAISLSPGSAGLNVVKGFH